MIVLDAELANEVPIIISDEPEVNRIFRPGIFLNIHKKKNKYIYEDKILQFNDNQYSINKLSG